MSKRVPVAYQKMWIMAIPQIVILAALVSGVGFLLYDPLGYIGFAVGAALYLLWSFGSRALIAKSQQQGMKLVKRGNFRPAIEKFEQSYDFFSRNEWIDHYRAIMLLIPSTVSYREIALVNIAFCYAQLGDGEQAKAYYQRTLAEFPDSSIAETAMNLIKAFDKSE